MPKRDRVVKWIAKLQLQNCDFFHFFAIAISQLFAIAIWFWKWDRNFKIWFSTHFTTQKRDELLSEVIRHQVVINLVALQKPLRAAICHQVQIILGRINLMKPDLIAVTFLVKKVHIVAPEVMCHMSLLMMTHRTICLNRVKKLQFNSIPHFLSSPVCWFLVGNQRNQFSNAKI